MLFCELICKIFQPYKRAPTLTFRSDAIQYLNHMHDPEETLRRLVNVTTKSKPAQRHLLEVLKILEGWDDAAEDLKRGSN